MQRVFCALSLVKSNGSSIMGKRENQAIALLSPLSLSSPSPPLAREEWWIMQKIANMIGFHYFLPFESEANPDAFNINPTTSVNSVYPLNH